MSEIKLCECGCGQRTPLAKRTETRRGHIKGQPIRKIQGHRLVENLVNMRFGRWIVISLFSTNPRYKSRWLCRCDCGTERVVKNQSLRDGSSTSCGCNRIEQVAKSARKHGLHKHPLYSVWIGMRQRCANPNHSGYKDYGARGIFVCERWNTSFESFLEDMGERPISCTLDRIDNDGPYSPENCRWATQSQQNKNSRSAHFLEYDGKRMTITEWAAHLNVNPASLYSRLRLGWSVERMLTHEIDTRCHHKSYK